MNTQREQLIHIWLTSVLNSSEFKIQFLAGDASFRRYARVEYKNNTYMLMDAPPEKEDCVPFVQIDEFFDRHGVRVPHIVAKDLSQGFLLLEDFGDVLLSNLLNVHTVNHYYLQAFAQLIHLQSIDAQGQFPAYAFDKLMSEMHLLTEWMLPSLDIQLSSAEQDMIQQTFELFANTALKQPQVIVHRDFHSRNLMKIQGEEELGVIDFQDAVIGADTYDLISITRDAYVQWSEDQVITWFEMFYDLLPDASKHDRDFKQFKRDADFMAIQRHIKILGIFVRLFERDGKSGYLKDLPRVMWYVLQESQPYAELKPFIEFLQNKVMPKFEQKYGVYEVIAK